MVVVKQNRLRVLGKNYTTNSFFSAALNVTEPSSKWEITEHKSESYISTYYFSKSAESWIYSTRDNTGQPPQLISFNDQSWQQLPYPSPNQLITSLIETENGILWALDNNYNLLYLKDSKWTKVGPITDENNKITTIIPGEANSLWAEIENVGIALFDGSNWTVFDSTRTGFNHLVPKYYNQNRKELWCIAYKSIRIFLYGKEYTSQITVGLYRFNGSTGELFTPKNSGLYDSEILSVIADDKSVWIASQAGLSRWDYSTSATRKNAMQNRKNKCNMQMYGKNSFKKGAVKFKLNSSGLVIIAIYDLSGRYSGKQNCGILKSGEHVIPINMDNRAQRIYLARILVENQME